MGKNDYGKLVVQSYAIYWLCSDFDKGTLDNTGQNHQGLVYVGFVGILVYFGFVFHVD